MTHTEIKPGDLVRILAGSHKGKTGTAIRVATIPEDGHKYKTVLVTFPAGEADYINLDELEKVEDDEK